MLEEWKPYKTRRSCYEVSNLGNVLDNNGNNVDIVLVNGRRCVNKRMAIYKLVWKLFNGEVPKGYCVHHIDHNKLNDRLDNLTLMTKKEHVSHHMKGNTYGTGYTMLGKHHSEESKKKMSEAHKKENLSEETILKMSQSAKLRKSSDETKKKMSELKKGSNNPFYGKKHSEESKRKMSEARQRYLKNKSNK